MASARPSKDEIFDAAAEIDDPAERAAYLDQACANNSKLRAEIENLLHHDREAGSFLKSVGSPPLGKTVIPPPSAESAGTIVGPYKLLEQIGEGGFGIVYMADQHEPVRRKVAIKIIKPGMDSKPVLARFEAERHALAMMDHPNIARALDAGVTDSGRPYFVMELVRGVPITDYCDQHNLDVRQRLDLFVTVCHAVQHAHQKGIIHRDIKPSNVLVTMSDGRPIPKVIDFGVAKAINQQLTEDTIFTRFAEMIGTPLYMSPEQAEMTSLDIDTRSDIYSLGVLLYELLTGTTPFEKERLKRAAFDEIRRIIREDEPEKPSTRISTLGATSAAVSARRHADPRRLSQIMRGDLDWIVMKALEKDRTRRYETANGLAMDIQRHLADEPVLAGPPSAAYRFRKFARRNKGALATSIFVSAALIVCSLTSTWYAIQAREARLLAEQRLNDTEKARKAATENLRKAREAVDEYFTLVSENKLLDVPGLQPLRKQLLEAALRYHQGFAGQASDDPQMLADLASSYLRVAEIDHATDRNDDAIVAMKKATLLIERLRREFPTDNAQHIRLSGFWKGARQVRSTSAPPSDGKGARTALEKIAGYWEDFVRENPTVTSFQSDLAAIYMHLSDLLLDSGQFAEGAAYAEKARSILERLVREHPSVPEFRADIGLIYQRLANGYRKSGNIQKAEELDALALAVRKEAAAADKNAPQHKFDFARNVQFLGDRLWRKGDVQQGEKALIDSKEIVQKLLDEYPDAPMYISRMGSIHKSFANMCRANRRTEELEHHIRRMMELRGDLVVRFAHIEPTTYTSEFGETVIELAKLLNDAGRSEEAMKTVKAGIDVLDRRLQNKSPEQASADWRRATACILLTKAKLLEKSGESVAAETPLTLCFGIIEGLGAEQVDDDKSREFLDQSYQALGRALSSAGRHDDSKRVHRKGADTMAKLATRFPDVSWIQAAVGHQLRNLAFESREAGETDERLSAFREAVTYFLPLSKKYPADGNYRLLISDCLHHCNRLLIDEKRFDESLDVCRQRIEIWETAVVRSPNDPRSILELSIAHNEYGTAQKAAGRLAEAEAGYRKALALKNELVVRWPNSADYRFHLAHTHQGIGFVMHDTKRLAEAEECFRTAHELFAKSAAAVPTIQYYRTDDGHALWHLGDALAALGRPDDAEKSYRESLAVFEKLAIDFPTSSFYRFELGFTHWKIGDLLSVGGRSSDAEVAYRAALKIYAKLLEESPGDAEYRSRLARSHVMLLDQLLAQRKHADAASIAFALSRVYPDQWNNHERAATDLEKCAEFAKTDESLPPADRTSVAEKYTKQAAELRREAREKIQPTSTTLSKPDAASADATATAPKDASPKPQQAPAP